MSKAEFAPEATARLIEQGNRRALARAITLVESAHPEHRQQATALLASSAKGSTSHSHRIVRNARCWQIYFY